ncbi:PKD domain-containing protein [Aeromicrobium ginsengisoli]|uniref:PKD domain-containing protein n=1 Tax=Aeromicrobium ginsengisoli TaxID=363867 RepID=A0A5M4FLN3_9ACTN|nr:PKD domain-containing protein [Aeromicrobium ginsengisoli]KAA1400395.1 PKD domain-containing protein [Aeromicrobium ginsengisoli]
MRSLLSAPRPRRRAALAAVLSIIAVPLVAASTAEAADACDPAQACVIVKVVSTSDGKGTTLETRYFNASELQAWGDGLVTAPPYLTRGQSGKVSPRPRPATALPLRTLLSSPVFTKDPETAVTFSESNGTSAPTVLDKPDFSDPATATDKDPYPFLDDLQPALYVTGTGQIGYVRPLRDEDDVNSTDQFKVDPGSSVTLTIHTTGKLLQPVAHASSTSVDTKATVSFSTTYAQKLRTNIIKWRWTFGDGETLHSAQEKPTHRYATKGTYPVFVEVRGTDGSYGRSAPIEMKVAKPPKPPKTSGGGGTGGGTGGGGTGGGYIPPYIPAPPSIDNPPSVDKPPTTDQPTTPVDDGLQEVEGFVLAGAGAEQGESIPGTQAQPQPTKASELSTSRKISGAVIGGLAVILLLGLGAEIETRWASTRLAHLRRRT